MSNLTILFLSDIIYLGVDEMSRENPKENLLRFPTMITPKQSEEIDAYRQDVGTLPAKGKAVRELLALGLETYWKNKKKD